MIATTGVLAGRLIAEQAHADTVWDILARIADGLPEIIAAGAAALVVVLAHRQRELGKAVAQIGATTDEVREHVANDHPNLRFDLDEKVAALGRKLDVVIGRMDSHDSSTRALTGAVTKLEERTSRIGDEVRTNNDLRREEDARLRGQLTSLSESVARQEEIARRRHPDDMV